MCRTLSVGVSGYFAWWRRPENRYVQADVILSASIRRIYQESRGTYGAPRVQAVLADDGLQVSRARITRLMKAAGLKVRCKRKFRTTTNSKHRHPVAENLLNRDFTANQPNHAYAVEFGVRRLGYSARALELSGGPDPTDELKSLWLLDGMIRQSFALFA